MAQNQPQWIGNFLCSLAAVFYTASNICLRRLAGADVDPLLVIFVKELVTVVVIGPWLVWQQLRGQSVFPSLGILLMLACTGTATQLLGNVNVQWSYGVVGLAVVMPAVFASMLMASALLGYLLLGERITWRAACAVGILVVAIVFLSSSVGRRSPGPTPKEEEAGRIAERAPTASIPAEASHLLADGSAWPGPEASSDDLRLPTVITPNMLRAEPVIEIAGNRSRPMTETTPGQTALGEWFGISGLAVLGIAASCLAGLVYAVLGVVIRWVSSRKTSVSATIFMITFMGVAWLGPMIFLGKSPEEPSPVPSDAWLWMIASGLLNLLGFASLTRGLHLTKVVYANLMNASQVALGSLAGILLFHEPLDGWLATGILLTVGGIVLVGFSNDKSGTSAE